MHLRGGGLGQDAAFGARFMLHQHFQWSSSPRSSFTQQSPTDIRHEDSYGIQDGYSPWQPRHQVDDVSITDDREQRLHEDDMVDELPSDGTSEWSRDI